MSTLKTPTVVTSALLALALAPASQGTLPYQQSSPGGTGDAAVTAAHALHAIYDVGTRQVVSVSSVQVESTPRGTQQAPGLSTALALYGTPCFLNGGIGQFTGAYSVDSIGTELVDWGDKHCQLTGVGTSFTIGYQTQAIDQALGGPGAALGFAIYDGTIGFGNLGHELLRVDLSGLPGFGYSASEPTTIQFGNTQVVFLTVFNTADPIDIPDGPIGWGFTQVDGFTGPMLIPQNQVETQVINVLDVYRPAPASAASYVTTANFGGSPFASTFFQLHEIDAAVWPATAVETTFGSANPANQFRSDVDPVMNRFWVGTVTLPFGGNSIVAFSAGGTSPTPYGNAGDLLIDLTMLADPIQIGTGTHAYYIPLDLAFIGQTFYTQAARFSMFQPLELLNRIELTLGF